MTPRTINLENYRVKSPISMPGPKPVPRCRPVHRKRPFLKGPIPWDWVSQAARLPGKTLHVALELWRESGCECSRTVHWSPSGMRRLGVSRGAGYVALARLEIAKLLTVKRRPGCAPLVTILDVAPHAEEIADAPMDLLT
jgi:hypothetical protein